MQYVNAYSHDSNNFHETRDFYIDLSLFAAEYVGRTGDARGLNE